MSKPDPRLVVRQRNLPHWFLAGSVYYVTYRAIVTPFAREERRLLVQHLRTGDGTYYDLLAAVVMPDHVHLVLIPRGEVTLSRIMKGIKGVSARLINRHRGTSGTVWQDESWDRIVRDTAELERVLQYMEENPFKAELVQRHQQYVGWYCNPDLLR